MTASSLPGVFHKRLKLLSDVMGTKNQHLYTLPSHQLASKGLVAQLVGHHTGDVSVWVNPHSSPEIFFSPERKSWDLYTYTSATAMNFLTMPPKR